MNITVHSDNYDPAVINDVYTHASIFDDVHLMPDTHRGKTVPIGFVAKADPEKIIPEVISADIGCGMSVHAIPKLDKDTVNWKAFYDHINNTIPSGANIFETEQNYDKLKDLRFPYDKSIYLRSFGTLGGGNHFIEVNAGKDYDYIVVHSGSRKLGNDVCKYYTSCMHFDKESFTKELQSVEPKFRNEKLDEIHKKWEITKTYLYGINAKNYLHDTDIAANYASDSRIKIMKNLLDFFGEKFTESRFFESRHNYMDLSDNIVRKGANPAHKGEKLIVPINMLDGSIIAIGTGNKDWLESAPHGAGRLIKRSAAKDMVSLKDYKEIMADVKSYSISEATINESPFCYRGIDEIIRNTKETMTIQEIITPIFNFKA